MTVVLLLIAILTALLAGLCVLAIGRSMFGMSQDADTEHEECRVGIVNIHDPYISSLIKDLHRGKAGKVRKMKEALNV